MSKLENIVNFFRSRLTSLKISPNISVDYNSWDDQIKLALKEQWEKLKEELRLHPNIIKEQKWSNGYSDGSRRENIVLDIEGVIMQLEGPYYPDPHYEHPPIIIKTEEQKGNESIDGLITGTSMVWAITHCTELKFNTFMDFLKATRTTNKNP